MRTTAIGFLGTTLDRGGHGQRWERWRPTVDLFRHEDLLVHRLELLIEPRFGALASEVVGDIASVSPETTVRVHPLTLPDPWDFEQVYEALLDWARAYPWRLDEEQYLVHITTGTHVEQICLFLLAEARELPGTPRADLAAASGRGEAGHLHRDRPRPVALRSPRLALRRAAARGAVLPQVRHRHAQRRLQPADRAHRARGHRLARAPAPHRAHRRGQVPARPAHLRAEEGAAPGGGALRGGELRHAARRRGDVRALRPRARRLHGRSPGARRAPAQRGRGHSLPRRDRRARAGRAGHAPAGPRGQGLPARGQRPRGAQRLPAHRGDQPRPRRRGARGAVPRGPARPHQPLDLPPARSRRAARGRRAQPRLRAGPLGRGRTAGG